MKDDRDEEAARLQSAMQSLPKCWTGKPVEVEASPKLIGEKLLALYVHEAGHAVAMALGGRGVKHLDVHPMLFLHGSGASRSSAGIAIPLPVDQYIREHPRLRVPVLARAMVETYAGPAAELRLRPGYEFEGAEADLDLVSKQAVDLALADFPTRWAASPHKLGVLDTNFYLRLVWQETCQLFLDDRVWAATQQIAEDLMQRPWAAGDRHRMSGAKVARIVRQHLPEGWDWSGLFEITTTSDWPPMMQRS